MVRRTTIAPPITRVHKLFRIRTIVNDSSRYKNGVTTKEVGEILVERQLSKKSILESGNKLKRARDHVLNASYLGLFIPIRRDHSFYYVTSPVGRLLGQYKFEDECPRDLHETSIFIDRMMHLKLTNAYDSRNTYTKFHTRPFLSLLTVLKRQALHLDQVHYLLGFHEDLATNPSVTKRLLRTFVRYSIADAISKFDEDFGLTKPIVRREIGRSTKPLVQWCQQGGLVTFDKDDWCRITEHGVLACDLYSDYLPIWYNRLGWNAPLQSALLLIYACAQMQGRKINRKYFDRDSLEALKELRKLGIFTLDFTRLRKSLDFDFYYDVPVNVRDQVSTLVKQISEDLGVPFGFSDLANLSILPSNFLEKELGESPSEKRYSDMSKAFGIEIPRRECFQTDFEWQTCIRLRALGFSAFPYQGEFEGISKLPMASDNPDILIRNKTRTLIECKSRAEWGDVLKFDKRIGGELMMYQQYAKDVKANAAAFICESEKVDDDKFIRPFTSNLRTLGKVVLITWAFIDLAQRNEKLRIKLTKALFQPEKLSDKEHILA